MWMHVRRYDNLPKRRAALLAFSIVALLIVACFTNLAFLIFPLCCLFSATAFSSYFLGRKLQASQPLAANRLLKSQAYLTRRFLIFLVTFVGITIIVFTVGYFAPPIRQILLHI
jgi:hypothetical protein